MERKRPALGEKGQYGYVRKPEERMKRSKKKVLQDGEETTVAGPSNDELDFMSEPVMLAGPPPLGVPGALPPTQLSDLVYPQLDLRFPHENISPEVAAARQNATEEEDDESEWQIRVNDGTQPQWAKRKAEPEEEGPIKKQHTESVLSCSVMSLADICFGSTGHMLPLILNKVDCMWLIKLSKILPMNIVLR